MVDPELLRSTVGSVRWEELRQAALVAIQACTETIAFLRLRGSDPQAIQAAKRAAAAVAEQAELFRRLDFGEAVIEAERERAIDETLAQCYPVPPPRDARHLHIVTAT
jgi:hypothetical protein